MTNDDTARRTREVMEALEALDHDPAVMLHVWQEIPGRLHAADLPKIETRRIRPDVTLYAQTGDDGTTRKDTVLCAGHLAGLNVAEERYVLLPGPGDGLACVVCGAGDPANDRVVFWCPVCKDETGIHEVDFDTRENLVHMDDPLDDPTVVTIAQNDTNYETLTFVCDSGHPLSALGLDIDYV